MPRKSCPLFFLSLSSRADEQWLLVLYSHRSFPLLNTLAISTAICSALSAAQCGVAVDDATDAAKNAAAIILTSPGLSAIYMAVVESRRIFRKLKSYVVYRFCATIQIVICLSTFIFASNCAIDSLFIILLALFNDLR